MEIIKTDHAVCSIGYHIIWCTKYRHKVLKGIVEVELKRILAEVCIYYEWKLRNIEVMPDHVHIYIQCNHLVSPGEIAKTLKSISAVKIFTLFPKMKGKKFWGSGLWSKSTYYATVGRITEEEVKNYIDEQKSK